MKELFKYYEEYKKYVTLSYNSGLDSLDIEDYDVWLKLWGA